MIFAYGTITLYGLTFQKCSANHTIFDSSTYEYFGQNGPRNTDGTITPLFAGVSTSSACRVSALKDIRFPGGIQPASDPFISEPGLPPPRTLPALLRPPG